MIDIDDLNLNISLILAILIFISDLDFMLSSAAAEYEKSFIISGPASLEF